MAEHHRKIELQSPDDLQYLISNVRRAANEKIDKDLPPIEGEDKMRRRVEELVSEVYCHHPMSNSLSIHCAETSNLYARAIIVYKAHLLKHLTF
jgi:hypothetical protein